MVVSHSARFCWDCGFPSSLRETGWNYAPLSHIQEPLFNYFSNRGTPNGSTDPHSADLGSKNNPSSKLIVNESPAGLLNDVMTLFLPDSQTDPADTDELAVKVISGSENILLDWETQKLRIQETDLTLPADRPQNSDPAKALWLISAGALRSHPDHDWSALCIGGRKRNAAVILNAANFGLETARLLIQSVSDFSPDGLIFGFPNEFLGYCPHPANLSVMDTAGESRIADFLIRQGTLLREEDMAAEIHRVQIDFRKALSQLEIDFPAFVTGSGSAGFWGWFELPSRTERDDAFRNLMLNHIYLGLLGSAGLSLTPPITVTTDEIGAIFASIKTALRNTLR